MTPEVFSLAKDEYELKKSEGLSDEQLFNYMKGFIEAKLAEQANGSAALEAPADAPADDTAVPAADPAPVVVEDTPVEAPVEVAAEGS